MDTRFDPKSTEETIYRMWESGGYFAPDKTRKGVPFSILLPPPNANADLHVGHAMYVAEDIMIRYHRMKGDPALWLPGADHAGFETQFVYEKHLKKQGKSRFDFDRETLYKSIWDFVHENRGKMENQLRRLGFSLDWTRNVFTLDPNVVKTVYQTFKKLYDDGLIYRSERLVNYCTHCGTGFSDLEVRHEDGVGILYYITYDVDGMDPIMVATTRPETMFGDQAIAVHPKDKRYSAYVGKTAHIPISGRAIPIIADTVVKKDFGTGAVKITPAHDENDFETGKRHALALLQVIGLNGKMLAIDAVPEAYHNLSVTKAREALVSAISTEPNRHLDHTDDTHAMVRGLCYKCGRVIEPLPLRQWFVTVRPLADKAIQAVKEKKISFVPKRFEKTAVTWLRNFHDWNISRQIVWGIRIPAWRCNSCFDGQTEKWIVTDGEPPASCPDCHGSDITQDSDTFDTWFSSGQWPFATLMATQPGDFEYFYPTSVMETGYDILPWWVCRMMMLGIYRTGDVPFRTVYLHGLVRDAKGQKMSKSKGNVINPLKMVDQYGADALRMALIFGTGAGNDQALSEDKIRGMRNFANKLWNIGRFLHMSITQTGEVPFYDAAARKKLQHKENKEILKELKLTVKRVTKYMETYRFSDAALTSYEFAWHRVADVYIEHSKERLRAGDLETVAVLRHVVLTLLKLLHPFMPFVTEALWSTVPRKYDGPVITSAWPK